MRAAGIVMNIEADDLTLSRPSAVRPLYINSNGK